MVGARRGIRGPTQMNDLLVEKTLMEPKPASQWWLNVFNAAEDAQIVCRKDGAAVRINPKAARRFKLDPLTDTGSLSIFDLSPRRRTARLAGF